MKIKVKMKIRREQKWFRKIRRRKKRSIGALPFGG
jgi:hypothetical protein